MSIKTCKETSFVDRTYFKMLVRVTMKTFFTQKLL